VSILVKGTNIEGVSAVVESEDGVSKVKSYRYPSEGTGSDIKSPPKYVREGSNYLKIQGGGVISADNGLWAKKKGKNYWKDHSDYKMVPHKESNHKVVQVSVTNPTPARR